MNGKTLQDAAIDILANGIIDHADKMSRLLAANSAMCALGALDQAKEHLDTSLRLLAQDISKEAHRRLDLILAEMEAKAQARRIAEDAITTAKEPEHGQG